MSLVLSGFNFIYAPGGLNGWFGSLATVLANNAALHQALAKISGEPLKIGDVVTDRFGVKHTYLGKDEYGNNMYSVVGVDSRGYYNPNNDPFINDLPNPAAPRHVDDFEGFWGKVNWVLNGGRSGNADYDWNGNYLRANYSVGGTAPIPDFSGVNLLKAAKAVRAARMVTQAEKGVFTVTKEGVVLPKGAKIPSQFIENPFRSSSYGLMENGKFVEKLRIDPATPPGMKGPNFSHYHLNGSGKHSTENWPWWAD